MEIKGRKPVLRALEKIMRVCNRPTPRSPGQIAPGLHTRAEEQLPLPPSLPPPGVMGRNNGIKQLPKGLMAQML